MIKRNSKEAVKTQTAWHCLNWVMNILCNPDRYSHSNKEDRKTTESGAIQSLTLTTPTFENEIQDNKLSRTRPHFLRISNCSWGLQLEFPGSGESHLKPTKFRVSPPPFLPRPPANESCRTTDDTITTSKLISKPRLYQPSPPAPEPHQSRSLENSAHSYFPSFIQHLLSAHCAKCLLGAGDTTANNTMKSLP